MKIRPQICSRHSLITCVDGGRLKMSLYLAAALGTGHVYCVIGGLDVLNNSQIALLSVTVAQRLSVRWWNSRMPTLAAFRNYNY